MKTRPIEVAAFAKLQSITSAHSSSRQQSCNETRSAVAHTCSIIGAGATASSFAEVVRFILATPRGYSRRRARGAVSLTDHTQPEECLTLVGSVLLCFDTRSLRHQSHCCNTAGHALSGWPQPQGRCDDARVNSCKGLELTFIKMLT